MKLEIFGWDILKTSLPEISFSKRDIEKVFKKEFSSSEIDTLNIIFTNKEHIKQLNKEFREKDYSPDVLSFEIEKEPLKGEIYICTDSIDNINEKEVLRLIVHGFLHVLGHLHKGFFEEDSKIQEDMFVKQEEILENISNSLGS